MVLIIGGAYQGKYVFAKEQFCPETESNGETGTLEDFKRVELILDFQQFIRKLLEQKKTLFDIINVVEEILVENPEVIIDINEVGSGIVPNESEERTYRETVGRISTWLATKRAEAVYRVMVGIGVQIK